MVGVRGLVDEFAIKRTKELILVASERRAVLTAAIERYETILRQREQDASVLTERELYYVSQFERQMIRFGLLQNPTPDENVSTLLQTLVTLLDQQLEIPAFWSSSASEPPVSRMSAAQICAAKTEFLASEVRRERAERAERDKKAARARAAALNGRHAKPPSFKRTVLLRVKGASPPVFAQRLALGEATQHATSPVPDDVSE